LRHRNIQQSKGEKFAELCRAVAMQIAATPGVEFVKAEDISDEVKEQERRLEMQAEDLVGKPDEIKAKMVEGRLGKILKKKVSSAQ
jgi:elongation factor Ts